MLQPPPFTLALTATHRRRLREVWRSAGWPFQDLIEAELLAAGLLERQRDEQGRDTLRVTDAGVQLIVQQLQRNRAARDAHEALVAKVAEQQAREGRLVWRGLSLRAGLPAVLPANMPASLADALPETLAAPAPATAPVATTVAPAMRWVNAMPDVFSIRPSTVADYIEPVVHEIKVRRADLLADLARPDKGAAYLALASRCWYVFPRGLAEPHEVPEAFGVMVQDGAGFEVLRAAPARPCGMALATWMALARRGAEALGGEEHQAMLGEQTRACGFSPCEGGGEPG